MSLPTRCVTLNPHQSTSQQGQRTDVQRARPLDRPESAHHQGLLPDLVRQPGLLQRGRAGGLRAAQQGHRRSHGASHPCGGREEEVWIVARGSLNIESLLYLDLARYLTVFSNLYVIN